jgi:tetratricopeptide (TPR) repeat protein
VATADSDQLRSLGRQLGEYVSRQRGMPPAPAALQGVVADLTAVQSDLQAPLRDLVSRQSFAALLPYARSSGGLIQRDALIQEISRVYHPDVLVRVEEVLNGFLDASGGIATSLMHDQVPVQIEKEISQAQKISSNSLTGTNTSRLPNHSNGATNHAGPSDRKLLAVSVATIGAIGLAAIGFQSISSQEESCSVIADQLEPLAADSSEFKQKITDHKAECADDSRFLVQQAILSDHLEQPQEALKLVNESIKINPEDATAYYWQGISLFNLGEYKKSLTSFDKSLQLKPDDSWSAFRRGVSLSWLNRGSEAVSAYTQAIKLDSSNSDAYRERGREKLALNKYPSGLEDVNKAIQIDASDEHAYHVRATIKTWLDDFDGACVDIKKSKQLGLKEGFKGKAIDAVIAEICADAST